MQISNHTFFVTGGSSGLGRAISLLLAEQKANVIIADVDEKAGKKLSALLKERAIYLHTDVTDPYSIDAALSEGARHFAGIHGLINCAGVLIVGRMIKKDGSLFALGRFRQSLEVNLVGTFNTIRSATPYLVKNRPDRNHERGIIINTASIAAFEGQVGQVGYAAAKAGVIGMTLPLARELGSFGIRVMTVAPGVFDTPLFSSLSEAARKALGQQVPFPSRLGQPQEYAVLVRHIIENVMLNGEVIRLDGGLRLGG